MGDWSEGEHNAFINSEHVEVKDESNDYCRFHTINAINNNLKSHGQWVNYLNNEKYREYIRKFECISTMHLDCCDTGVDIIEKDSWKYISGSDKLEFRTFWNEYIKPQWGNKLQKMNVQGSLVMDNNNSEGWNFKGIIDLKGNDFWGFLFELKRYFAIVAIKYERFKEKGFERKRSSQRVERCLALQAIWTKFDLLDRNNRDIVRKYLDCLYLCWENRYDELYDELQRF